MVFLHSLSYVTGRQTLGHLSRLLSGKRGSRAPARTHILLATFITALSMLLLTAVFYNRLVGAQSGTTVLSVTATQPIAGATPGVFTIRRTGDTSQPLTVQLSLSGTAVQNVDYTLDTPATANLAPAIVPGKVAQAFSFDGQSRYVQAGADPKLDPTEEATVDAWVYFNQLPSASGKIMMIADKSDFGRDFLLDAEPDNRFHFSIGTGRKVASTTVIQTGRWYHVAATYKALTETKLYVNGVLENTLAIDQRRAPSSFVPFTIGRTLGLAFVAGPSFFNGLIDEVHVFNRALSDAEIHSIFAADSNGLCKTNAQTPNCLQPASGLVGWFTGDGDLRNLAESIFSPGKVGQAFTFNTIGTPNFNNVPEYVQYPSLASQDPTSETTVDAWVNFSVLPSETGNFMTIIDKSGLFRDLSLVAVGDNTIRFSLPFANVASKTVVQKGRWYHIAATFKANTELKMYINGVLENTAIPGSRAASGSPLTIGNSASDLTRAFTGLIDEAQMYNRALSASEIQSIFNADSGGLCKPTGQTPNCVPPPSGLVGWWTGDGNAVDLVTRTRGKLVGYDDRFFGQQLTFAAAQTSVTVNVRPLFSPNSAGKNVVLTLLPDAQNSYGVDALQGSATVYLSGRVPTQDVLLTSIAPNKGGNSGSVTPVIYGQGFKPGVTVKLVRAGQPDIVAAQTNPAADETSVAATFDLTGKPQGVYDVVVANASGTPKTLNGAFTIETTRRGNLSVKIISRKIIRIGSEYTFYVQYGNDGNVDETNVVLYVGVPNFVSIMPETGLPFKVVPFGTYTDILFLPRVPAGSNLQPEVLPIKVKVANAGDAHRRFRMLAEIFRLAYIPVVSGLGTTTSGSESKKSDVSLHPLGSGFAVAPFFPPPPPPPNPPCSGCPSLLDVPDPPDDEDDGGGDTDPQTPNDPNGKSGTGVGDSSYIAGKTTLPYNIYFENEETASLPAQDVFVTDQLDPSKVDLSTFSFGTISFGNRRFTPPVGQQSFTSVVDLRPEKNLLVKITANMNPTSGLISWTFNSLDPATGRAPDDPQAGFLPQNRISPEGQGAVTFTLMPKGGLATNTVIANKARIVFDVNAPIDTGVVTNTIDNTAPVSAVQALPAAVPYSFIVNWSGTDQGSGVNLYKILVSDNGAAYTKFLNTFNTSAVFTGQAGHTYKFYSVATDQVGNAEATKTTAEATTTVNVASGNAIDDATFFVSQHYRDFLNRTPDPDGFNFWVGQIASCQGNAQCIDIKRQNVSAAYFLSIEFQQTGYLVERFYKAAYGSASGTSTFGGTHQLSVPIVRFNEFLPDTQRIGEGVVVGQTGWETVLENNKQAFASEFVLRSRFTAAFPTTLTPQQFVNQLFANAGVTPSATELAAAIGEFGSATNTTDTAARARALRRVAENATLVTNEFNRAFVLMQYFGYLRRDPNSGQDTDYTGYDFWLAKLNQFNGNFLAAEMVKAFITSSEYRQRFGP